MSFTLANSLIANFVQIRVPWVFISHYKSGALWDDDLKLSNPFILPFVIHFVSVHFRVSKKNIECVLGVLFSRKELNVECNLHH